jgi:hypothetical protein
MRDSGVSVESYLVKKGGRMLYRLPNKNEGGGDSSRCQIYFVLWGKGEGRKEMDG